MLDVNSDVYVYFDTFVSFCIFMHVSEANHISMNLCRILYL